MLREQGWEYQLQASYIEVYNESLRDLLAEGRGRDVGKISDQNAIKHDPKGTWSIVTHSSVAVSLHLLPTLAAAAEAACH